MAWKLFQNTIIKKHKINNLDFDNIDIVPKSVYISIVKLDTKY